MTVTPSDGSGSHWSPPPDPAFDHVSAPGTPTPPIEPVIPARSSRLRWVAAAALSVVALVVLIGGLALANFRPASSNVLQTYASAEVDVYAEARLDLPGDQRAKLLEFLGHLPGFEDEAAFDARIADLFDSLASEADEGVRWEADILPWFGGQVAAFGTVEFSPEQLAEGEPPNDDVVVAASVRDRAAALDFIAGRAENHGWASEDYRDATIWEGQLQREHVVLALTSDAVLAGQSGGVVRAAIDVAAGDAPGLGTVASYSEAVARFHADRLGTLYIDGTALADLTGDGPQGLVGLGFGSATTFQTLVVEVRAEGDHMALTSRVRPAADGPPLPSNRTTTLAARVPADSFLYVETRATGESLGFAIEGVLDTLAELDPEGGGFVPQLETLLGTPPEEFLDFLDDAAIAIARAGDSFTGGMVATVTDEDLAGERLDRLVGVLRTGIAFEELPLMIAEEEYGGATLTVIRLGPGEEGFPGGMPGMGMGLDMDIPAISYTVHDGVLILGVDDFVRSVVDGDGTNGLASTERFASAVAAGGGTENAGVAYLDLAAVRGLLEEAMHEEPDEEYRDRIEPYLGALERLVAVTVRDGDDLVSRALLFVE